MIRKPSIAVRKVILATVLAALIAACGGCRSRQPSSAGETLRVLALFPMTGPGASLGAYLSNGLALAKEDLDVRYQGQLKVEYEILDSKNQPGEGLSALRAALARSRPHAVLCAMSSVSKAVVPVLERERIPTIVTTTALTDITKGTRFVVRMYPTSEDFVLPVAQFMAARFRRVAVFYVRDDFGESNYRVFQKIMTEAGRTITAAEPFDLAPADARTLIARVLAGKPEGVFVTGYGPSFISMFRQIREANRNVPLFTEIGFANPAVLEGVGAAAEGVIFDGTELELSDPSSERVKSFQDRYHRRYSVPAYQVTGFAYDSLCLLAEAARKAGGPAMLSKSALVSLSPFTGIMGAVQLDAEGESRVQLRLMRRHGSRTVPIAVNGSGQ